MTPVTWLAGFCLVMAAVAVARVVAADGRDPVDAGTAAIVAGIAIGAAGWALADATAATDGTRTVLVLAGSLAVLGGIGVVKRHWA